MHQATVLQPYHPMPTTSTTAAVLPLRPHTFRLDNALIDTWGEQIGATAVALYCALSRYANRQTGVCWPSITTLSVKLRLGRNTVKKYLRVLVQHGLVEWHPRWDEAGDQTSHLYTVHPCPAPQPMAPAAPAGGRSVADPPSVNQHGGGESTADPEGDLEGIKRTPVPIALCELKKKQSKRKDTPAVQLTLETLTHDFTAILQHRAEVDERVALVRALDPVVYQNLEAQAWEVIRREPSVNSAYVLRPQVELLMADLLAGEGQPPTGRV